MAHKSKTQRAKATAAKAARKEREVRDEAARESAELAAAAAPPKSASEVRKEERALAKAEKAAEKAAAAEAKEQAKKAKPKRFQFFRDVRAEMKRVTWPTRQDVMRWSVVVVAALIFFGVYVFILDYGIITKVLLALSNLAG